MIYFDNAATTKPYSSVLETFTKANETLWGNPHSLHTMGMRAEQLLESARKQILNLLDGNGYRAVFTSGATESNNSAIFGCIKTFSARGNHIITSAVEHPSVLEVFKKLELDGFDVTYLPVNSSGEVELSTLKDSLRSDTILVSIMAVNNESGAINRIKDMAHIIRDNSIAKFHVDGVQMVGKLPLSLNSIGVDFFSISAHKFHGLKGSGVLFMRESIVLEPLIVGGGQEEGFRSGTGDVARAASIAKALRLSLENMDNNYKKVASLRDYLCNKLSKIGGVEFNSTVSGSPYIVNISVDRVKPETLIHSLASRDIYLSTVSACSSRKDRESLPIYEMTKNHDRASSTIRISLSGGSTEKECEQFISIFKNCLDDIRIN